MRSTFLIFMVAALSEGLPSSTGREDVAPLMARDNGPPQPKQGYICPKTSSSQPDAIIKNPINVTELAFAQQQIKSWCDSGVEIAPGTGGPGHVEVYGNASVQFCNQDQTVTRCNSTTMQFVLDGIQCGTRDDVIEGYGQLEDSSRATPENWYIFYSARGSNVSNCMDTDTLKKMDFDKKDYP